MAGVAVAASVALAAGMTGPAAAEPAAPRATADSAQQRGPQQRIQLITGDRVVVDAEGKVVGLERAEGREKVPVQVQRLGGHTLVVPLDAMRMIAEGTLDKRLFDITELNSDPNRRAQKKGLKLIVGYRGGAAGTRSEVREAGDTQVRRNLKSLNAEALITPKGDTPEIWEALTDAQRGGSRTTASGVDRVWLDGVRKASLDRSVRQIGADKAWAAGYDGTGVKIAVLDTGIDTTHPDLKDQVVAEKNFSAAPDATDKVGHGTHVASIAAGTGAKSGGAYKGVAPGAKLLNGKVLDDEGYGDDSGILAGIDWAVSEGADVINLSLGGPDSPETDPLEEAVDMHSAQNGVLFAVAAGNEGESGAGTIGSPGSADSALTVGAVDRGDKLAPFSSTGPRVGDGAIKPDVTAPGVDIMAAAAKGSLIDLDPDVPHSPDGAYLAISGTSMATPHVAGAAALLKQQHPDWKSAELKGVLTGSAKGGGHTPFEEGAGRIQVDRAIGQTVFADPVSLSFGLAAWPHTDDPLLTKKVTYRNLEAQNVTLDLSVTSLAPDGQAAPAGFFTLGATKLTVPAGGTAAVDLTVNTKLDGAADGQYSAYVTASGGGQSVRTAAFVEREVESYDVTVRNIGRDGQQAVMYYNVLAGYSGLAKGKGFFDGLKPGDIKFRAPRGGYLLEANIFTTGEDEVEGHDWTAQPNLQVTKDTTITVDARKAEPVELTVPGVTDPPKFASVGYELDTDKDPVGFGWLFGEGFGGFRTQHLGGEVPHGLRQIFDAHFLKGESSMYSVVYGGPVKRLATGWTKHVEQRELATLKLGLGASVPGKEGTVTAFGHVPGSQWASSFAVPKALPTTRTLYVSTADDVRWSTDFLQYGPPDEHGMPVNEAVYEVSPPRTYRAGRTYTTAFNTAVIGPKLDSRTGVFRKGDEIYGFMPLFADGMNHTGASVYSSVKTELYRNGRKIGENDNPLTGSPGTGGEPGEGAFTVPAAEGSYRLVSSVRRDPTVARATSRVEVAFTFRSAKAAGAAEVRLPVSVVRFSPSVALDSTAPAGERVSVPVTVQGAAAGKNLKSLTVYVSYDSGGTWRKLTVDDGRVEFRNPAVGKSVSFHAKISDKEGNTTAMSVYDAYYGK